MKKYIVSALFLIAIIFASLYLWAPTSTCDECDESSGAKRLDTSTLYDQAAKNNEIEKQIYYSLIGALKGNKELERKYLTSFGGMDAARQQGSIAAVKRMPPSARRDALLRKMREQANRR